MLQLTPIIEKSENQQNLQRTTSKIHKMLLNMQSIADLSYLYVIYMIFDRLG